jgi:class 3 adenylate cyclase
LADFAYESFAQTELTRLAEARQAALEDRIEADLANGDHAALVGELESLVREHPLRERLWAQLMLALYRSGRQADALDAYQRARAHLAEELGLEPGPALRTLQIQILEQNASLDLRRPPAHQIEMPQSHDAGVAAREPAATRQERKVVTVVVAELVDVVERSERRDAEDVLALLARYQERLGREIERFGGTVESFVGEEMIALFGAPVAHEDDPERAVRAALAIRDWAGQPGAPQVRIAVDTQEALVTIGADEERRATMGAGAAVGRTARLQSAAPVGGILVGERAYRATRECIEYRQTTLGASRSSVPVWEALEAHSQRGVDLVRTSRVELVGRVRELDLLESVLSRVVEERAPQLVTLVGVPGIGKSRVVFELAEGSGATSSGSPGCRDGVSPTATVSASGHWARSSRRTPGSSSPTVPSRPLRSCAPRSPGY